MEGAAPDRGDSAEARHLGGIAVRWSGGAELSGAVFAPAIDSAVGQCAGMNEARTHLLEACEQEGRALRGRLRLRRRQAQLAAVVVPPASNVVRSFVARGAGVVAVAGADPGGGGERREVRRRG